MCDPFTTKSVETVRHRALLVTYADICVEKIFVGVEETCIEVIDIDVEENLDGIEGIFTGC